MTDYDDGKSNKIQRIFIGVTLVITVLGMIYIMRRSLQ
jgi:heme/copper-type cytochrome/quinol oxidase subunit 4